MSFISRISLARFQRIEDYITNLEERIELKSKKDREIIDEINVLIREKIKAVKKIQVITVILFLGIYFSFVSFFFSEVLLLGFVTEVIGQIVGFFGTTIFIIGLFVANRFKELYYQDLTLLTAHLITLYSKIGYIEDERIFDESNMYRIFLNFFKKRGF